MKQIELNGPSLDSFVRTTAPDPEPRRGEVLVKMRAAALNYLDLAVATGGYEAARFPLVPVADGAGEVVAVGDDVDTIEVGDRVAVHPKALWTAGASTPRRANTMRGVVLPGSLRELAAVPAETLVKAPPHLSWDAIATLPIPASTAWRALEEAHVGAGSLVVVLGTGGVSILALQLAKARGARVLVTSSSDAKLERARALGADHLVNYVKTPAWDEVVREVTGGHGADLVIESAGATTFPRSLAALRHGATAFTIGFLSGTKTELDLLAVIVRSLRIVGTNGGSAEDLAAAMEVIRAHRIEPVVDRTYALDDLERAYGALRNGEHFGKLAITIA